MTFITDALAQYGATISAEGFIKKGDKVLGVRPVVAKNRVRFVSAGGDVLASGPATQEAIVRFVESFWFWKKVAV